MVHLYLGTYKDRKNNKQIIVVAVKDGQRVRYNTGKKTPETLWNKEAEMIRKTHPNFQQEKAYLEKVKSRATEFVSICENGEMQFNGANFQMYMNETLNRGKRKIETVDDVYSLFLDYEKTKLNEKGERVKESTIKKYIVNQRKFLEFEETQRKSFKIEEINREVLEDFQKFLTYKKDHKAGQVHKDIVLLKTVLTFAEYKGFRINPDYKACKPKAPKVENVALHYDELQQLRNFDLSNNPTLEDYQIMFLVGCFTGARPSDFVNFTEENITTLPSGDKAITYHAEKTGKKTTIPISEELDEVLKKRNYTFPKINLNLINRNIKKICAMAGLDRKIEIQYIKGGERVTESGKLFDFVVGKTAKRTFVTILHNGKNGDGKGGMSLVEIANYTGNNYDTIRRYLVNTPEYSLMKIKNMFDGRKQSE